MHNKNVVYVTDSRLKAENEEMLAMLKEVTKEVLFKGSDLTTRQKEFIKQATILIRKIEKG